MRSLAGVVVLALTASAAATPTAADRESSEADALVAAGEFAKAAIKFRAAYAQDPRPSLICNAGVAYYRAKDFPRAHYYLGRCLKVRDKLEASFVASLTKAIAAVTAKLEAEHYPRIELAPDPATATIVISGTGSPFDEPLVAGVVWVPPGHYTLSFHAPGHDDKSHEVDVKRDQTINENVQLAVTAGTPATRPDGSDGGLTEPHPHVKPPPVRRPPDPIVDEPVARSKLPAIVATAATGVFAIAAVASYVIASGHANDAGAATTQADYDTARDSAVSYQHASWVFGGIAGAGAIVSGILWYRAMSAPSVEIRATGSGATISLGGRF